MNDMKVAIKDNVYELTNEMYIATLKGVRSILSETNSYMIFCIEKDKLGMMVQEKYNTLEELEVARLKYTEDGYLVYSIGRVDEQ